MGEWGRRQKTRGVRGGGGGFTLGVLPVLIRRVGFQATGKNEKKKKGGREPEV